MEIREVIQNTLGIAVILSLLALLAFVTGVVKAKKDPVQKKKYANRAWICLGIYSALNILRLLMERGIL